jgi:nucleotide-binding universal stress UspA family protein
MTGKRQNAHFRKLLVGYDGSSQSEKAVDMAFSLAECLDATVLIFAVDFGRIGSGAGRREGTF